MRACEHESKKAREHASMRAWEHYLNDALCTLEFELERQLKLELDRKSNEPVAPRVSAKQVRDGRNGIKRY